jgi:predicted CopG family antitoxin
MDTTIQISGELLEKLRNMKVDNKESYETIIWDLIEDKLEFSAQTKANLKKSEEDINKGRTISLGQLKKKIGI